MGARIAYACLQATQEGQASFAHVHEIIKGLEVRGFNVDLFEPHYSGSRPPGAIARGWAFAWVQARLLLSLRRYDAVYIRSHFAAWPVALISKLFGVPVLQEVNGAYEDLFVSWPWTRKLSFIFIPLARIQFKWADGVIAVTDQLAHWVTAESGNTKVRVISNGADTNHFRPLRLAERPAGTYVLFFGALSVWQGVGLLVDAAQSPTWPRGVKLVIAGDGAERSKVQEAAERLGHLEYLGKKSYRELPQLIAGAKAGLCPKVDVAGHSQTGLMPLKLFEMMASGIPVIVTDFPGQADLVRSHEAGVVIPQGDPEALANAVARLMADPEEAARFGRNGREAVVAHHSWDRRAADTAEALESLMRQGARA